MGSYHLTHPWGKSQQAGTCASSGTDNNSSRYQPLRFCHRPFPPVNNYLLSTWPSPFLTYRTFLPYAASCGFSNVEETITVRKHSLLSTLHTGAFAAPICRMNCVYPDETIGCHGSKRTRQVCRAQQVIGMTRRREGHDQLPRSF